MARLWQETSHFLKPTFDVSDRGTLSRGAASSLRRDLPWSVACPALRIRNRCSYVLVVNSRLPIALHILGFLTARAGQPLTSEVMAATYGTSPVVLRRVLAQLHRAGLVDTQRGPNGGSVLACDPSEITVRDAYEAVTAEPAMLARHPQDCSGRVERAMAAFVNGLMSDAEAALLERLDTVTIAEMDAQIRASLRAGCATVAPPR